MFDNLLLEVLKVDHIAPFDEMQGVIDKNALILPNHIRKGVVDGLLNEHRITVPCKSADGCCDSKDDAGRDDEIAPLDLPIVPCAEPVLKDVKVVVFDLCIAEDAVIGACLQCVNDGNGGAEVHVRDPERQDVLWVAALGGEVVFQTGGALAVDDFVKIDVHIYYPS